VRAGRSGHLAAVDAEAIGRAAAGVGAGPIRKEHAVDLAVGVDILISKGDAAEDDTLVACVHANDEEAAAAAGRRVLDALTWSDTPVEPPPLVHAVVG
jgi:thymidine phosphorylase